MASKSDRTESQTSVKTIKWGDPSTKEARDRGDASLLPQGRIASPYGQRPDIGGPATTESDDDTTPSNGA